MRRFALFCFAFDFVLPSTFWGFSHTIHSFPSPPPLSLSFFHHHCFPSLSFAPFPAASVFAAYTQNATANFQLRHERELTSLLRSRSLAFALSLPLPLSAAYETSSASAALNVKCLDCVSAWLCVCSLWEIVEKSDSDSAAATSTATPPPPLSHPPHCSLYNEVCCFEA